MNPKRSIIALVVVLVAVSANVFSAFAYPTEMPEVTPAQDQPNVCQLAVAASTQVDIPARRSDYALLDRAEQCAVGALKVLPLIIPVTGAQNSKYAAFKELQADLMSGSAIKSYTTNRNRFYEFKARQAEERSY